MKNLILYNEEGKVHSLLNDFKGELKDGIFNTTLKYKQVSDDVFKYLSGKWNDTIHFIDKDIVDSKITSKDFTFAPKPPIPPAPPTESELLAKAIFETELQQNKFKTQAKALGQASFQSTMENIKLKKQVETLSKAVFELAFKK